MLAMTLIAGSVTYGQDKPSMNIYGFAMLDMGFQSKQNDPAWFDVLRPTKLPAFENQYGMDGRFFAGVRQSRLGFKGYIPTDLGELRTIFEFEMFGVGVDAGQTTIRLRHAYGELGDFGAGQYWSPFMDIDVFPNSIEYWGPSGMAFFRNVQIRWMPIQGDTRMTIAVERPGASGDGGVYSNRIELMDIAPRFPYPDVSAEYRMGQDWGYVEGAGIVRYIGWDDLGMQAGDFEDNVIGWGVTVSTGITLGEKNRIHGQVAYGAGIQNYFNDAPADVGVTMDTSAIGEALPVLGAVLFYDHYWSPKWSSSIGYSMVDIDNSDGQAASAFKTGHYALVNLLYYPVPDVMMGGELQYGKRENNSDGFTSDDLRFQVSFRYSFSQMIGG